MSPIATSAAAIVRENTSSEVYPETLEAGLGIERWQAVCLLQDLASAGYGSFILGRRGGRTRLEKANPLPGSSVGASLEALSDKLGDRDEQVFLLKRPHPVQIRVPADLTVNEAERLSKWLCAIAID